MKVLHANLASLSGTKTVPYLVMFLTSNLGGWAGDHLISQHITTTAGGRKTVNTIGVPLALGSALIMTAGMRLGVTQTTGI